MVKMILLVAVVTIVCIALEKAFAKNPTYMDFPPEYYGDDELGRHQSSRKLTKKELREDMERQAKYTQKQRDKGNRDRIIHL
jgi:ABC-type siderophore export system fused ATPase/permease subunit